MQSKNKQRIVSIFSTSTATPLLVIFRLYLFGLFFSFIQADLLCKNCGHTVTTASALRNVKSPNAIDHWNLTVLGVDTLVQVFRNSVPETYNVVLANGADLKFAGKAHGEETWFPGMSWRTCMCSQCSNHIGWYFQSPKDDFVGLVLDYLISSEYVDTLTKVPLPRHNLMNKEEL